MRIRWNNVAVFFAVLAAVWLVVAQWQGFSAIGRDLADLASPHSPTRDRLSGLITLGVVLLIVAVLARLLRRGHTPGGGR